MKKNKEQKTELTLKFFIDCEMNCAMNKIKESIDYISLLKHWMISFDNMHPFIQNNVIRKINELAGKKEFYDCFDPMKEVEE